MCEYWNKTRGREKSDNVIDVNYKSDEIYNAILKQIKNGKYPKSNLFGDGNSGKKIAQILSTVEPKIQKKFPIQLDIYEMKKSFCIIPVRGGSKGIPRKNLLKIHENLSLLEWTIFQAKKYMTLQI